MSKEVLLQSANRVGSSLQQRIGSAYKVTANRASILRDEVRVRLLIVHFMHGKANHEAEILIHVIEGKNFPWLGKDGYWAQADWVGTSAREKKWWPHPTTKEDLANFIYDKIFKNYLEDSFSAAA